MNEQQPKIRDAKPLFASLLGLILFLFGIAIGYTLSGNTLIGENNKGYNEGYADAKSELQTQLETKGIIPSKEELSMLANEPVFSINGSIIAIDGATLTLEASLPSLDPLAETKIKTYTIQVTDKTDIVKEEEMTPEEIEASFTAFEKKQQEYNIRVQELLDNPDFDGILPNPPEPPNSFKKTPLTFNDLSVGMMVSVNAESDLREVTTFDAVNISFSVGITLSEEPILPEENIPEEPPIEPIVEETPSL